MRCPHCRSWALRVIDSRSAQDGAAIRRRRVCEDCEYRFSTFELAPSRATELEALVERQRRDDRRTRLGFGARFEDRRHQRSRGA